MRKRVLLCVNTEPYERLRKSPLYPRIKQFSEDFTKVYVLCKGNKKVVKESESLIFLSSSVWGWRSYLKEIKSCHIIFSSNFVSKGLLALLISKITKKPYVLRIGTPWVYKRRTIATFFKTFVVSTLKRIVLQGASKVVYNSKSIIQHGIKHSYSVVYNGVDTAFFKPRTSKKRKEKFSVLYVGRISREKGVDFLLEAIEGIKERVTLGVVGQGDIKLKERYPFAQYYGRVDHKDLVKIINEYDAFVFPSLVESLPNAVLEAMACQKPVIATNVWGIPEMIENNVNGLLIKPRSVERIRNAILKLLDDKDMCKRLAKNARKTAVEKFEMKRQLKELSKELFD